MPMQRLKPSGSPQSGVLLHGRLLKPKGPKSHSRIGALTTGKLQKNLPCSASPVASTDISISLPLEDRTENPGRPCKNRKEKPAKSKDVDYDRIMAKIPPERLLRVKRISPKTVLQYHKHISAFYEWCRLHHRSTRTQALVDKALAIYFNELFEDSCSMNEASYTLFGWICLRMKPTVPERELLPMARAALPAWRSSTCVKARVGVIPQVLFRFLDFCIEQNNLDVAMAALLQYNLYARPSEILNISGADMIMPIPSLNSHWGIVFGNSEFSRPRKTGTFDDAVFADSTCRPWCGDLIKRIYRCLGHNSRPVFQMTLSQYESNFRFFSKNFKFPSGSFFPHVLRHSGPSFDVIHYPRSLAQVQARGRWTSSSSVARYRKPGRLLLQATKFPIGLQNYSSALSKSALAILLSKWIPPEPTP